MVQQLATNEEFETLAKGTVIIDFTATWCGPCQFIGPEFVKLAEANKDNATCYPHNSINCSLVDGKTEFVVFERDHVSGVHCQIAEAAVFLYRFTFWSLFHFFDHGL